MIIKNLSQYNKRNIKYVYAKDFDKLMNIKNEKRKILIQICGSVSGERCLSITAKVLK